MNIHYFKLVTKTSQKKDKKENKQYIQTKCLFDESKAV